MTPRKAPTQARARETVETLLRATAHILRKEGYEHASTNRIAQKAGISIGSLYQYFPSKEALVAALVEELFKEELELFEPMLELLKDEPIERVAREIVAAILRNHKNDTELRRIIIQQVPRVGRLERMLDINAHFVRILAAHLQRRNQEIGLEDPEIAAFILVHAAVSIIHSALTQRPDLLKNPLFEKETVRLVLGYLHPRR